jgi:hypothetical protein
MKNAFVEGLGWGSRGLGYEIFLSWLWGCLGVQGFRVEGKKISTFCKGKTWFFFSRVGGGGSHSCGFLKDVLNHPPIRVWQQMKNVHNKKRIACQKVSFSTK